MEKTRTRLSHKMWAKVGAYFLLTLSGLTLALSVLGACFLLSGQVYSRPLEEVKTDVMRSSVHSAFYNLISAVEQDRTVSAQALADATNGEYELIDYTDNMEAPLWKSRDYDSVSAMDGSLHITMAFVRQEDLYYYCYAFKLNSPEELSPDSMARMRSQGERLILINAAIDTGYPIRDQYRLIDQGLDLAYALRYWVYAIALAALVLFIVCFIFILCGAGHREGREELVPGPITRVPFDLLTAVLFFAAALAACLGDSFGGSAVLVYAAVGITAAIPLVTGWCASFALRVKLGGWWRNTVIFYALRLCRRVLRWFVRGLRRLGGGLAALLKSIPLVWKTAVGFLALSVIELIFIGFCWWVMDVLLFWWIVEKLLLAGAVLYFALVLRRLQAGGRAIAAGDLSYQVDDKHMFGDFKEHAENLNSIGLGMTRAVDERMKSERFKTELITNVSHDIKTPLTSIINYSDLICRENCENEKHMEYAQVLHRQSERLKKLLEDLMEASKASTGNVEVHLAPCETGVLLTQAAGEYEQRLAQCGLELIVRQPQEPIRIMADGRHISRVFDNLMNNITKYAQPGTRVYLTLEEMDGKAVISFKNTSRYALDISSEELMERFVRGDSSRSTEGSGLGLSIARSLTELQGGTLELVVDGDLFKAVLRFDVL